MNSVFYIRKYKQLPVRFSFSRSFFERKVRIGKQLQQQEVPCLISLLFYPLRNLMHELKFSPSTYWIFEEDEQQHRLASNSSMQPFTYTFSFHEGEFVLNGGNEAREWTHIYEYINHIIVCIMMTILTPLFTRRYSPINGETEHQWDDDWTNWNHSCCERSLSSGSRNEQW